METTKFEDLELTSEILRAVKYMGFEETTPIQAKAIPAMRSGIDIIGQAQTGTGKTAAFGIPLLEKIDIKNKRPQAIVQRTCHSGRRRNPESGPLPARNQNPSDLRRPGNLHADPLLKKRNPDHHRNSGSGDGPHAQKNP